MDNLTFIQIEDLPNLRKLYEAEKPLHVVTTVAIGHFIARFRNKPEWKELVIFCSLNDNWKHNGTFAMINKRDNHILFNTLEPSPYQSLHKLLQLINYDKPMVFVCFRDLFRPIVLDVIRVRNLEIIFDSGTKCMYHPTIETPFDAPDGFYIDSVKQCHVPEIDAKWVQHSHSQDFLSNCIAQNPSTGLFNKETGELVAYILMLETGAAGHFFVDEKYRHRKKGFAEAVSYVQRLKIRKHLGYDVIGHVAHQNNISFHFATKTDKAQWIENNSWIGIRQKEPKKEVPLWGRL